MTRLRGHELVFDWTQHSSESQVQAANRSRLWAGTLLSALELESWQDHARLALAAAAAELVVVRAGLDMDLV